MKSKRIYYYTDEIKDEFSGVVRDTVKVDQSYRYIHNNIVWKICSFLIYRIIMTPIAYLFMKFRFHLSIVNRKVLKRQYRQQELEKQKGIFLYGNHTQIPGDGFLPTILTFPMRDYVIVNADNISLKGTRTFMEMVGACVKPNQMSGMKNFLKTVGRRVKDGNAVAIYPEAHIWPFYTGIRPFKSDSFAFPAMFSAPAYCFTVTYQRRRFRNYPKMTVYVDGPFYADQGVTKREAQQQLRDQIYETMKNRAKASNYEYYTYKKKGKQDD